MTQEPKHPHNRKKHPNWGGRRPGAGAPRGNMNALKHGRRSVRMARLGMLFASNPVARAALLSIADRWERKEMKAEEVAKHIFDQILERGIEVADDRGGKRRQATPDDIFEDPSRLIVLPPVADRRSIEPEPRDRGATDDGTTPTQAQKEKSHRPIKQDRRRNPHHRSRSKRETPLDRT
jgi:hypothetical protein